MVLSSYIRQLSAHQDGLSPLYATSDWQTHILAQNDENTDSSHSDQETEPLTMSDTLPLTTCILNISAQALLPRGDVWVCRERLIDAVKIILGRPFERFLENQVRTLTSGESCVHYLEVLRETLWPGGHLIQPSPHIHTDLQRQRTRSRAKNTFVNFLPGFITSLIGRPEVEYGVDQVLDAFTHQQLNRHLAYNLLDLLVSRLFPELSQPPVKLHRPSVVSLGSSSAH